MTQRKTKPRPLTLKDAFETEYARREMERRARADEERRQQERDLSEASRLHEALVADGKFLEEKGLTADQRRYAVSLDHERYRIAAYFESGVAHVSLTDKRPGASPPPRKEDTAEGADEALRLMAQYLAEETR